MQVLDKELWKDNRKFLIGLILFLIVLIAYEYGKEYLPTFLFSSKIDTNSLMITEIMTSNQGIYADPDGNCYDWVELYNGSKEDISLLGYTLNDNEYGNNLWSFPDVTIKSGEYKVIYLTGLLSEEKEGLYVPFALNKAGGEVLTLKDSKGKMIEKVSLKKLNKNTVLRKNEKNKFEISKEITPGYPNTSEGRKNYLNSLQGEESNLVINEFLSNNKGVYIQDGILYPYIELKNLGDTTILLKEYFLSDDDNRPFLWRLEDISLKPGEIYLVYPTGKNDGNQANFSIDRKDGKLILSHKNKIIDSVSYEVKKSGYAFVKYDKEWKETLAITPGYDNTDSGMREYAKSMQYPKELILSEIMNGNHSYLKQKNGEYYDWIEFYNNSTIALDLSEYTLSTSKNNKNGIRLPKKILKPGEYYVFLETDNIKNFSITDNQSYYLYKGDKIIDSLYLGKTPVGYSYGKHSSGGYYYYHSPTPGKKNTNGNIFISNAPLFSKSPGIYQDTKELFIQLEGKGKIYYTLDGSNPSKSSTLYKEPIKISKTSVIKAIAYEDGKYASEIESGSYIMNENHTLPVMSISLPKSSFQKLINNPTSRTLIVKAHAELYEKDSSFSVDCGFKIFGGESRTLDKKSFSLKFSSKYGEPNLEYPIFQNRTIEKYDNLVLRSGSQDMMTAMMRDELGTSIMVDYGNVDAQSYKPVVLYINGSYWGIYYLREKINENFISEHYNIDKKGTNIVRISGRLDAGSRKDYNSLIQYVSSHDLSVPENYRYVKSKLDIDNYIAFLVGTFYTNNFDVNNTRFFNNPNLDNGKIKLIFYDLDYSFRPYPTNFIPWLLNPDGAGVLEVDNTLIRALMNSDEFKERFLDIFFFNLKYVWTEEHVLNRYYEIYNAIKPEMKRNQERWGYSYEAWEKNCQDLKKFIQGREKNLLKQVKSYFHLSDKEIEERMNKKHRLKDIFFYNATLKKE